MRATSFVMAVALSVMVPSLASADGGSYTVEAGDSLWSIAERHDVSIRDLAEANGIELSHVIHPGESLLIPGRGAPVTTSTESVTVRPGDSLWSIAQQSGVTLGTLLAASGLTVNSVIHPGQIITLPARSADRSKPTLSPQAVPSDSISNATYTVRAGDGFTTIARRLGVSTTELLTANDMARSSVIHPGQELIVPERSVPTEVASSADLRETFERAAVEADVPADLLMAVAFVESRWNQSARSPDGAIGVGQLMPSTATWIARDLMGEPDLDPTRTADNIRMSAHLLAWLLDEGGSTDRALAMYLQGVYGVRANGISPAAAAYADKVDTARAGFR